MNLYVGTDDGLVQLGEHQGTELSGMHVTALHVRRDSIWCIGDDTTLWRSNGEGWSPVANVESDQLRCVRDTSSGVLVGTGEGHLLRLVDDQLVRVESFDHVEGRERWWNVGGSLGEQGNVRSLAEGPDGAVYVNVHVGGIYRSIDGGASWTPTIDQEADVHEVVALGSGRLIAATGMEGLVLSDDAGDSWISVTKGLPADGWGGYTRSVAAWDDQTLLVTGSRGSFSDLEGGVLGGVYCWSSATPDELRRCTEGLPAGFPDNIDTGLLAAGPGYAVFGAAHAVYVTQDAGESWRVLRDGLPNITCLAARA